MSVKVLIVRLKSIKYFILSECIQDNKLIIVFYVPSYYIVRADIECLHSRNKTTVHTCKSW